MSSARDAVLGNFTGPLCVIWKYGTVNDWMAWRTVNKKFRHVNDVIYLNQWKIYILERYIPSLLQVEQGSRYGSNSAQTIEGYTCLIRESLTIQLVWKRTKVLRSLLCLHVRQAEENTWERRWHVYHNEKQQKEKHHTQAMKEPAIK